MKMMHSFKSYWLETKKRDTADIHNTYVVVTQ